MLINGSVKGEDMVKKIIFFLSFFCLLSFLTHDSCSANSKGEILFLAKISKQAIPNSNTLRMENNQLSWQTQGGIGVYNLISGKKEYIKTNGNFPKICSNYLVYSKDLDDNNSVKLCLYNLDTKKEKDIYISPDACCFPCFDIKEFRLVWYEGGKYLAFYNLLTNQKEKLDLFPEEYNFPIDNVLEITLNNDWLVCSYFFNGQLQTCIYNLANKEKKIIEGIISPKLSNDYLVYQRETGFIAGELHRNVFLYDLKNGEERKISSSSNTGGTSIYSDWVAWQELEPSQQSDGKSSPGYGKVNYVKLFNISTKEETPIPTNTQVFYSNEMILYKDKLVLLSSKTGKGYWDLNLLNI